MDSTPVWFFGDSRCIYRHGERVAQQVYRDFPQSHHKNVVKNSAALVRQRTIPTERPPLVGEVNANFSG
jgi:hypothetical protein